MVTRVLVLLAVALETLWPVLCHCAGKAEHVVVVVWDGMRPDFVSEKWTPALHRLARSGVFFTNNHSVYFSSTEVNGTALATGMYPEHSGVIANREYRPTIEPLKSIGIEALESVRKGDLVSGGHYLKTPTVAEILQHEGLKTAVAGTKAVAILHDRADREPGHPGLSLFTDRTLPTNEWHRLVKELGSYPSATSPNALRDDWTSRALTRVFWKDAVPKYSLLWLSEPDFSQHDTAPGSQTSLAALKSSDNNLALVLSELERRGIRDKTDVFVVSDHGFSTIREGVDVSAALRAGGFNAHREFKTPPATNDIVVVGNGGSILLYVAGRDSSVVRRVVDFLQQQEFTGTIFTREPMEGTFALELAKINSSDAPDIAFSMRWRADANVYGAHGLVATDTDEAKARAIRVLAMIDIFFGTHVTTSRYDLHNTLIAAGPDFRRGLVSLLPSGNVDVAPTVLHILGVTPPQPMDGRVLTEAMTIPGPAVGSPKTTTLNASNRVGNRVWRQYLKRTELNGVVYLDEGNGGATAN